ncbi:reticulocyte binding protein homologue 3, putative [Plasmodium gaboni]|uniref:Reticulocyte binding protein homologue 3, putative n=1 Tax=Plasmodium gaboni TaxID=647221 RepID=A0ABY1US02_9APIC|nr:reticulocyte binding protein homologue 3, putative [Plasmodium gaboni]
MRKGLIYRTILCNILLILIEKSHQNNIYKVKGNNENFEFSHLNFFSKNNEGLKFSKKKFSKGVNLSPEKYSNNNNDNDYSYKYYDSNSRRKRDNKKNKPSSNLFRPNLFVTLNERGFSNHPTHASFINKIKVTGPNEVNNNPMSFIIKSLSDDLRNNNIIENEDPKLLDDNNLYQIDMIDENGNLKFSLYPHYVNINACKEMIHYSTYYNEETEFMNSSLYKILEPLSKYMHEIKSKCLNEKNNLLNEIHNLENPKYYKNNEQDIYEKNIKNYQLLRNNFENCLNKYNENINKKIYEMNTNIRNMLSHRICINNTCDLKNYNLIVELYLYHINELPEKTYHNHLNHAKELLEFSSNAINDMDKSILGHKEILHSISFVQLEIQDIIKRYKFHLNHSNKGISEIKHISTNQARLSNINKTILMNKSFELAKTFSNFKISTEILDMLNNLLNKKKGILQELLNSLMEDIKIQLNRILSPNNLDSKYENIRSKANTTLKAAEKCLSENKWKIKDYEMVSTLEMINVKNSGYEKLYILEKSINKLKKLLNDINIKFEIIKDAKIKLGGLDENKSTDINGQKKNIMNLLHIIESIKENDKIQNLEHYFIDINNINSEINLLIENIENSLSQLMKLQEDEDNKNTLIIEIKSKMDSIKEKLKHMYDIIHINDTINNTVLEVEKIIDENSLVLNDYITKKNNILDNINIINKNFFHNNNNDNNNINNTHHHHYNNLKNFVKDRKNFIDKNVNYIYEYHTTQDINIMLNNTVTEYKKLEFMNSEVFDNVSKKLKEELQNLVTLKERLMNMKQNVLKIDPLKNLNRLLEKYEELKKVINEYSDEQPKLDDFKKKMEIRLNEFITDLNKNDQTLDDGKNIYDQFVEYKEQLLIKKRIIINNEIVIINDEVKKIKDQLKSHNILSYKLENDSTVDVDTSEENTPNSNVPLAVSNSSSIFSTYKPSELNKLIDFFSEKGNEVNIESKIKQDESIFIEKNKIFDDIIKDIELYNKKNNAIKILNKAINGSMNNLSIIDAAIKNKHRIENKLSQRSYLIQTDNFIDIYEKIFLKGILNKGLVETENRLSNTYMNDLKVEAQKQNAHYNELKKNINTYDDAFLEKLMGDNYEWEVLKIELNGLNINYNILQKNIDTLIIKPYIDQIDHITLLIKSLKHKIDNKIKKTINTLERFKEFVQNNFNTKNIKLDENNTNNGYNNGESNHKKILEDKKEDLYKNIDEQKYEVEKLRINLEENMNKTKHEIENMNISYGIKKNNLIDIYESMNDILNSIITMNEELYKLKNVDDLKILYEIILIEEINEKIRNEIKEATVELVEIELYKRKIALSMKNSISEDISKLTPFKYNEIYDMCINKGKNIKELYEKASSLLEDSCKHKNMDIIKKNKSVLDEYLKTTIENNNDIKNNLTTLKNIYSILQNNEFDAVTRYVLENSNKCEYYAKELELELEKENSLTKKMKLKIKNAEEYKNIALGTRKHESIDIYIRNIKTIKQEISNIQSDIMKCIKNSYDNKTKSILHFENVHRGTYLFNILNEKKNVVPGSSEHENTSSQNESENVIDYYQKCITYSEEASNNYIEISSRKDSLLQFENEITNILNDVLIFNMKKTLENKMDSVNNILEDMKLTASIINQKSNLLSEKIRVLRNHKNIKDDEELLNNEKSKIAYEQFELYMGKLEYGISDINRLNAKAQKIFDKAQFLMKPMLDMSLIFNNKNLEELRNKEEIYMENIEYIQDEEKHIKYELAKLNEVIEFVDKIEKLLNKYRKYYEQGNLENTYKNSNKIKGRIEETKDSLNILVTIFSSIKNSTYLKKHTVKMEDLNSYINKVNGIYDKFMDSYKLLQKAIIESSSDNTGYEELKEVNGNIQKFEINLVKAEEDMKLYWNSIKKDVYNKLIYYIKDMLLELDKRCKSVDKILNEGFEFINKCSQDSNAMDDDNSIYNELNKAINKYKEIHAESNFVCKNEAESLFGIIVKSSNIIGMKIITGLGLELTEEVDLGTMSLLNSSLHFHTESINKLDSATESKVYEKINDCLKSGLDIVKYSFDVEKKKRKINSIMEEINNVHFHITMKIGLSNMINDSRNKISTVLNKIYVSLNKIKNVKEMTCDDRSYHMLMEKDEYNKLKEYYKNYNEDKTNILNKLNTNKLKDDLNTCKKSLDELQNTMKNTIEEESSKKVIKDIKKSYDEINERISNTEKDAEEINVVLEELVKRQNKCKESWYTSLIGKVNTKISFDKKRFLDRQQISQSFLDSMKMNFNMINKMINKINNHFEKNQINSYSLGSVEKTMNYINDSKEKGNTVISLIDDMTKILSIDNNNNNNNDNNNDIIDLIKNNKENLLNNYSELGTKEKDLENIYLRIFFSKLEEIEKSSEKYFSISKAFNDVVKYQGQKLSDNIKKMNSIKNIIEDKENILNNINNKFTLENIKEFNKAYDNILFHMRDLYDLEEAKYDVGRKLNIYIEYIYHIRNKSNNLMNNFHDIKSTEYIMIHETDQLKNDINEYMNKINTNINNTNKELDIILRNIKINNNVVNNNHQIKKVIDNFWMHLDSIKSNFSKFLPEGEKLVLIKNYLNDIKNIMNEIMGKEQVDDSIKTCSKKLDIELDKINKMKQNNAITDDMVENLFSVKDKYKNEFLLTNDILKRVQNKNDEMNKVYKTLTVNTDNNENKIALKYLSDVNALINEIKLSVSTMENFLKIVDGKTKNFEMYRDRKLYSNHPVTLSSDGKFDIEDEEEEEEDEVNVEDEKNISSSQDTTLSHHEVENKNEKEKESDQPNDKTNRGQLLNEEYVKVKEHRRENSNKGKHRFNYNNYSNKGFDYSKIKYASGFVVGLIICSSVGFIFRKEKHKDEVDFNGNAEDFQFAKTNNIAEKEELIEVPFNENDYI